MLMNACFHPPPPSLRCVCALYTAGRQRVRAVTYHRNAPRHLERFREHHVSKKNFPNSLMIKKIPSLIPYNATRQSRIRRLTFCVEAIVSRKDKKRIKPSTSFGFLECLSIGSVLSLGGI